MYHIDRIVSASIVSADIMCITAASAAVNTGGITQVIKGHLLPVTRQASVLEGREEGDCNLIPASPWHHDGTVLGLGHQRQMMQRPLHQQELITTVSTVNHSNVSAKN